MHKKIIVLLLLGLIMWIIPYFLPFHHIIKVSIILVGSVLFCLSLIFFNQNYRLVKIFLFPFLTMILLFLIDYFIVSTFHLKPIIAIENVTNANVKIYNSFLYRAYECKDIITIDKKHNKNYMCSIDDLESISINELLKDPEEAYKNYHNKFVRIKGKVSKIIGNSSLELNAYNEEVNPNGYVDYITSKKIVLDNILIEEDKYFVYDFIEVIGRVSKLENDNNAYAIYLKDAIILPNELYKKYELKVNENSNNELVKISDNMYYVGLGGIYYKYNDEYIYELGYLLQDKREKIENLIDNITPELSEESDEIYKLSDYTILKCQNENIIFLNKKIKKYDYCEHKN